MNFIPVELLTNIISFCDKQTVVNVSLTERDICSKMWDLVGRNFSVESLTCIDRKSKCVECNNMKIIDICSDCYADYIDNKTIIEENYKYENRQDFIEIYEDYIDEMNYDDEWINQYEEDIPELEY